MIKNVPKASINKRPFQVFKEWTVDESSYPFISASNESGLFDTSSFNTQNGVYTYPLYKSIQNKYYNQSANPFTVFGEIENFANIATERRVSDTIYVLSLPQTKYGEGIKKKTLTLTDKDTGLIFADDGNSNIVSNVPLYGITNIDLELATITITDNEGDIFVGTITSIDLDSGIAILTFGSDTDSVLVTQIDLENSQITFPVELDFDGIQIDIQKYGNIFYGDGVIIFNNIPSITNYEMNYRSTQTIYENEILITAKAGEFNYSQNPSAVDVTVARTYKHPITRRRNYFPAGIRKIKEVSDIKRKEFFTGSFDTTVSGSWNDYYDSASIDPTGSFITTYISTIGLYDDAGDMVAVAKLPTPIKNLPDYDMNFIVRFDT
jgi:hypothetical protein